MEMQVARSSPLVTTEISHRPFALVDFFPTRSRAATFFSHICTVLYCTVRSSAGQPSCTNQAFSARNTRQHPKRLPLHRTFAKQTQCGIVLQPNLFSPPMIKKRAPILRILYVHLLFVATHTNHGARNGAISYTTQWSPRSCSRPDTQREGSSW